MRISGRSSARCRKCASFPRLQALAAVFCAWRPAAWGPVGRSRSSTANGSPFASEQLVPRVRRFAHRYRNGVHMAGLDKDTLLAALSALDEFAKRRLPDSELLELDAKDEFPEDIVKEMCGPELGIQLFFLPEELHGMGAGSFDLYRLCERMGRVDVGI